MSTAVADPHAPLPGSLILTLFESPERSLTVRSVELLGDGSRLRFSFTRRNRLHQVLDPAASAEVDQLLEKAPGETGMILLPDYAMKLKDLILANARLIVAPNPTGGRYFSIRFEKVFGKLSSFFSQSVDVANAVAQQGRVMASAAIKAVCLPLFDFATFLENANDSSLFGDRDRLYKHLSETRDRIRELEGYYDELEKLVDTEDRTRISDDAPPPGTRLQ